MQPICELLPKTVKKDDVERHVRGALVSRAAAEALGSILLMPGAFRPRSFRDGVLTLACRRPLLGKVISDRQAELVTAVNRRLGFPAVRRIRTY